MFINNNELDDIEENKKHSRKKKIDVSLTEEDNFYKEDITKQPKPKTSFWKRFTKKEEKKKDNIEENFYNNDDIINKVEEYKDDTNNKMIINNKFMGKYTILGLVIIIISMFIIFVNNPFKKENIDINLTSLGLVKGSNHQISILTNYKNINFKTTSHDIINLNETTGFIESLNEGEAKISVLEGNNEIGNLTIYVVKESIPIIDFNVNDITLNIGDKRLLQITPIPSNTTEIKFRYKSQSDSIVSIDNNNFITANKEGTTTITITNNSIVKKINVTVK